MNKEEKIVKNFIRLREDYLKKVGYQNIIADMIHAGKSFYLAYNDDFWGKLKNDFSGGFPIYLSFIFQGKVHWISTFYDGYTEKEVLKIKKLEIRYIKKNKDEMDRAKKKALNWLGKNKILKNKNLDYYINQIQFAYLILLETLKPYQLSIFINPFLEKQLEEVFGGSRYGKDEYLARAVSLKESSIGKHERLAGKLTKYFIKKKINLNKVKYEDLLSDIEFKKIFRQCYEAGYFLGATIGGVKLWSPEDEFNEIIKISKDRQVKIKSETLKRIILTQNQNKWIKISQHFSWQRDERKTLQQMIFYYQAECLESISKIIKYPMRELENLKPEDLNKKILSDKRKLKLKINEIKRGHLFLSTQKNGYFIKYGDEARKIYKKISKRVKKTRMIRGFVANKGRVSGIARIIYNTNNKYFFNKGDVLVTGMTYPDFVPLMKKSAAIVTDVGGITCHAAIISREIGKPCIIGTDIATRVIEDGDLVEVDANRGVVKIIKKAKK